MLHAYIIGLVALVLLAKPRKTRRPAPPKPSDGLPWLLSIDTDKWHDLIVPLESIDWEAENDKGWSCYTATIETDADGVMEDEEIPFFGKQSFYDAVIEPWNDGDEIAALRVRRTRDGPKRNVLEFKQQ